MTVIEVSAAAAAVTGKIIKIKLEQRGNEEFGYEDG